MKTIGLSYLGDKDCELKKGSAYEVKGISRIIDYDKRPYVVLKYDENSESDINDTEAIVFSVVDRKSASGTAYSDIQVVWQGKRWAIINEKRLELINTFVGINKDNAKKLHDKLLGC